MHAKVQQTDSNQHLSNLEDKNQVVWKSGNQIVRLTGIVFSRTFFRTYLSASHDYAMHSYKKGVYT